MKIFHAMMTLACVLGICMAAFGQPSVSWEGLTGLFTQPTAEILPTGTAAITYSEIRFGQECGSDCLKDAWFSGSLTYAIAPRWEVALTNRHEVVESLLNGSNAPVNEIDSVQLIGQVKYVIFPVEPKRIGLAAGIFDVTDATKDIRDLDTDRGRRFFLVGTYQWADLGLTHDGRGYGAFAGAKWRVGNQLELIAEITSDPLFVRMTPIPPNCRNFNLGVRFVPCEVPDLRIDAAAVGDGRFNFGFSFSYYIHL